MLCGGQFVADGFEVGTDFGFERAGLLEEAGKLGGQAFHLGVERLAIVRLFLDPDITSGREDEILFGDLGGRRNGAEALLVLQRAGFVPVERLREQRDVVIGKFAEPAGDHRAHLPRVDETRFALLLLRAVEEPKARGDLRGVKELRGERDDRRHEVVLHDPPADVALAAGLRGERAVGEDHADPAARRQVPDHVLKPREVGVAGGRDAVSPAGIVHELVAAPVGEVERGIGEDEVGAHRGVAVLKERVGVVRAEVRLDAADGKVHLSHFPGGGVGVLAVDGDVVDAAGMALDELGGLHEHAAGAAAGVVDAPLERLQDLHERFHDAGGREELAALLALLLGEHGEAVFVGAAEDVARVAVLLHADVREEVDHVAEAALVELGAGERLREDTLQARVLLLDCEHGAVDDLADLGRVGGVRDAFPAGFRRHEKDVLLRVGVRILLEPLALRHKLVAPRVEPVGEVFQEDEAEDDVFVLGGVQIAAQDAGGVPYLFLESDRGCVFRHGVLALERCVSLSAVSSSR